MLSSKSGLNNLKQTEKFEMNPARYALQVALQTMKERCQKLQNRLSCLEEENLQLRIEKHKLSANGNEGSSSITSLEKKVAELSRQKSQLSHHILMVATENKELWHRLSKLTEENEHLGNHLVTLSDSLSKQFPCPSKPDTSINIVDSCVSKGKGGRDESLEEVSLKVLNSLSKGKPGLDSQDNEQTEELQNGSVSLDECGFTLDGKESREEADESLLAEMKEILERMKSEKEILKQQQDGLKNALGAFKKVSADGILCKKCKSKEDEVKFREAIGGAMSNTVNGVGGSEKLSLIKDPSSANNLSYYTPSKEEQFEARICPLCQEFYPKSVHPNEFHEHVISHFVEEETEDSITANFEVQSLSCNSKEKDLNITKESHVNDIKIFNSGVNTASPSTLKSMINSKKSSRLVRYMRKRYHS